MILKLNSCLKSPKIMKNGWEFDPVTVELKLIASHGCLFILYIFSINTAISASGLFLSLKVHFLLI